MSSLFSPILVPDELLAATSDEAWLQAMLDAEGALARAEAATGLIPAEAATAISAACAAERFDAGGLGRAARAGGNPVIPLVSALAALVPESARPFVHFGTTSQDILDTAEALVAHRATALLLDDLAAMRMVTADLADRHRGTLMAGRTLLQQALPITFGLKAAGWLAGLLDAEAQLVAARSSLAVQLGGAVGTLSALGARGDDVVARFAAELGLPAPPMPWHTSRQRIAGLAGALAVVAGSAGKVALDVTLLAQTEVGEVREAGAPGKGGSSAMPHKRNPVDALASLTAARRTTALVPIVLAALVAEHERGIAGWQAEWSTLTELLALTGGAVAHCCASLTGLEIDADAMRRNLDRAGGVELAERLNLALAPSLGRDEARKRVEQAVAATDEMPFAEALLADPAIAGVLDAAQVAALLDPSSYLGSAQLWIDRTLAANREQPR